KGLGEDLVIDANTQYFISDPAVVEVTASGLVIAKQVGQAVITVVNQGKQGLIHVNVTELRTGAVQVGADEGVSVGDGTGNIVNVAAGSLTADTTVSIQELDLDSLSTPLPMEGVLTTLAAVQIDLQGATLDVPMQVAFDIGNSVEAGTTVYFMREGTITLADGSEQTLWWIVDDG